MHTNLAGSTATSAVDAELDALTSAFPRIPVRIVLEIFLSYLWSRPPLPPRDAARATRQRLADACLVV